MASLLPVDEPTPWVSQLVITCKKSGALCVCIDPRELNRALICEHYTLPILEDTLHELSTSKLFTKADLSQGYWHIPIDYESSLLTTFNTYLGRYRWKRLPFGICVSSEVFQKRLHQALEGLQGVVCIADDIIIHRKDTETHDQNLNAFLQRCLDVGIKLNKEKLELLTNAITFLGHRISGNGLEADLEKVKAINEMEPPTNVSQLCTYEALGERRSPWPRQIITPIMPTVGRSNPKCSGSLPAPQSCHGTAIMVLFAHLLNFEDLDHHQNLISSSFTTQDSFIKFPLDPFITF